MNYTNYYHDELFKVKFTPKDIFVLYANRKQKASEKDHANVTRGQVYKTWLFSKETS